MSVLVANVSVQVADVSTAANSGSAVPAAPCAAPASSLSSSWLAAARDAPGPAHA